MSPCIECGRPREAHAADGSCPWSHETKFSTMDLPEGKTCSDCRHIGFCLQFLGEDVAGNTSCDWFPIRFVSKIQEARI
jgi:hypothetical protein